MAVEYNFHSKESKLVTRFLCDCIESTMESTNDEKTDQVQVVQITNNPLLEFKHKNHSLSINASSVAACVGYHEFHSLPELMLQHVYQGGRALLEHDAKLLGLQLVSSSDTEAELLQLAESSGSATVLQSVQRALQIKHGDPDAKLQSVEEATKLKQTIAKHAKTKLTQHQLQILQEGTRQAIDTGCGHSWEEQALDQYERQCGWEVRERNATCKVWDFATLDNDNEQPTIRPLGPARAKPRRKHGTVVHSDETSLGNNNTNHRFDSRGVKRKLPSSYDSQISETALMDFSNQPPETDSNSVKKDASGDAICIEKDENDSGPDQRHIRPEQNSTILQRNERSRPFVTIKGMVDGIRDELGPSTVSSLEEANKNGQGGDNDDDDVSCNSFSLSRVVVECKHRMNKLLNGPRFSESIQAVVYCFMYEVDDADIVQVLRSKNGTKKALLTDHFETLDSNNDKADVTQKDQDNKSQKNADETKENESEKAKDNIKIEEGEVSTNDKTEASKERSPATDKNEAIENNVTMTIGVDRVSLDDPNFGHRANWNTIILPKLRQWVDAVYRIRESDDKRYRLLASLSAIEVSSSQEVLEETRKHHAKAAWELVFEECSFLREGLSGERYRRETQ